MPLIRIEGTTLICHHSLHQQNSQSELQSVAWTPALGIFMSIEAEYIASSIYDAPRRCGHADQLAAVATALNASPRKIPDRQTPAEICGKLRPGHEIMP